MRTLILAVLLLSASAVAGGAEPLSLFPAGDWTMKRYTEPTIPLVVDIDFTRSKTFAHGMPRFIITVVTEQKNIISFDSRPLRPGEKIHWEGKIPASGTFLFYGLTESNSTYSADSLSPQQTGIKINVTGDKNGHWSGIGTCKDPEKSICIKLYPNNF